MYVCMFWFEYGRHEEARFFFLFFGPLLVLLSLFRVLENGVILDVEVDSIPVL